MRVKKVTGGTNPVAKAESEPDPLRLALRVAREGESRSAGRRPSVRS